jgi:hypothetical protein
LGAAQAGKGRTGKALGQGFDEGSAVGVAGGFAGGEEDARVGVYRDTSSVVVFRDISFCGILWPKWCGSGLGEYRTIAI